MKTYPSIGQLAKDAGISERTAWRSFKQGRIKKKRSEDDRMIFVLVDEPSDTIDPGITPVSSGMSDGTIPVTRERKETGKTMSIENHVSASLNTLQSPFTLKSLAHDVVKSFEGMPGFHVVRNKRKRV